MSKLTIPDKTRNNYRLTGIGCVALNETSFTVGTRNIAGGHMLTIGDYDADLRKLTIIDGEMGKLAPGMALYVRIGIDDGYELHKLKIVAVDVEGRMVTLERDLPLPPPNTGGAWIGSVIDKQRKVTAFASGDMCFAPGDYATASGTMTLASGFGAHAGGILCEARGDAAAAFGQNLRNHATAAFLVGNTGELAPDIENSGAFAVAGGADGYPLLVRQFRAVENPVYPAAGEPEFITEIDFSVTIGGHLLFSTVILDGDAPVMDHALAGRWKAMPEAVMTPQAINWRDGDFGELIIYNGADMFQFPADWQWIGTQPTLKNNGIDVFTIFKIDDQFYIKPRTGSGGGELPEIDNVPTANSDNLITSGGVYAALGDIEAALDAIIGGV